jgi:hypothetical protein
MVIYGAVMAGKIREIATCTPEFDATAVLIYTVITLPAAK